MKKSGYTQEKNFGLPEASYDPIKTIEMEATMFKNMGKSDKNRSLLLRISIIILASVIFTIPAIFLIYLESIMLINKSERENTPFAILIIALIFSLFLLAIGLKITHSNIKKSN
jgi:hypothetical protein